MKTVYYMMERAAGMIVAAERKMKSPATTKHGRNQPGGRMSIPTEKDENDENERARETLRESVPGVQ
jgi:hypothetical protein